MAFTAAIVLVFVLGSYAYVHYRFLKRYDTTHLKTTPASKNLTYPQESFYSLSVPTESQRTTPEATPIIIGELKLKDVAGEELGVYPIAIASSGWFAFPIQFLIGARSWQVVLDNRAAFAVEGAVLQDGDPVGLWSVTINAPLSSIPLAPWAPQQPLRWSPLDEAVTDSRTVQASSYERLGNFDRIPFTDENISPGIFTQDDKIVGWSFGTLAPGGYLWTGSPGKALTSEFYTDDFYRLTFEGSREEMLLLTLADPNLSEMQRLEAFAEAYLLESRMSTDHLPDRIAPVRIHQTIRQLVNDMREQNRTEELLSLFGPQVLTAVNYPPLIFDLATAAQEAGDYAYALDLIEMLSQSKSGETRDTQDVIRRQAAVYSDWLNSLFTAEDIEGARTIYAEAIDRFPRDPAIQLAGAELLLRGGNWELAERGLAGRRYPPELQDRVIRLKREIADIKAQEGKIVIHFRPGSPTIPITATLDRTIEQNFLIDTGTTIVTIPSETASQLGIDLSGSLPRRLFYSATGAQNAIEVMLPAIEINGWTITNVKALVVDLPGQPDVGLLGMNYLSNFRMDLDTDQGVLTLAPR